jgi:hypothetical protein
MSSQDVARFVGAKKQFSESQARGFFTNHRLYEADFKHVVSIVMHLFVFEWKILLFSWDL